MKTSPARGNWLGLRLAAISLLLNMSIETSTVFLPLYARSIGASVLDVGFIVASYGMAFFASSIIFGRQSDIHGRVVFVRLGLGAAALAYAAQVAALSPTVLLAARVFVGLSLGACSAAITTYVFEAQGKVGKFVSYGALGWVAGGGIAAWLTDYHVLFVVSGSASAIAFGLSMTLRETGYQRVRVAAFPISLIKANKWVYAPFFLRQMGAQAAWAVFPLFLASLGASRPWIAVMDIINNVGQFIAMRFVDRYDAGKLIKVGLALSVVVFAAYGFSTSYRQVLPVQAVLSIAWSCLFIGGLTYLYQRNVERGTASGLLYSATHLSTGAGPMVGGAVSAFWGFSALMFVSSGLALAGLLLSRRIER